MSVERHLILQELILQPSAEWHPTFHGWLIARVAEGAGYWMQGTTARALGAGDGFVIAPKEGGRLRVSQLGSLKLQSFVIQPEHLNGVLTVTESQQFEAASPAMASYASFFAAADPVSAKFARICAQFETNKLAMRCALLQLWAGLVGGLVSAPPVEIGNDGGKLRSRFRRLVGEMTESELAECSLSNLARQLHCSERHFSRLFHEEFRVPFRAHQIELRLQRARQLLAGSDAKIINVAYDSGYRHLGLFNSMFKKRFGLTPSEWRRQNRGPGKSPGSPPRNGKGGLRFGLALLFLFQLLFSSAASTVSSPGEPDLRNVGAAIADLKSADDLRAQTNAAAHPKHEPAKPRPPLRFHVDRYWIEGNTLLSSNILSAIFTNHPEAFGTRVTFDDVRAVLTDLQLAYRVRGYVTVSVGLPPQKLTNATIRVRVTEGRLAAIHVGGKDWHHWYSTNNVLRALPGLRTNMLLNSHVFQRELDTANANRDRQIYPVIGPGPDPGTSELTLDVKDQFPLHGRFEVNNQGTPGTPDWRAVLNAQYDNLWNLEHQIGVQYSCSFEQFENGDYFIRTPFDKPLIANYSGYYRLPLFGPSSVQEEIDANPGAFGYNEVTHQFVMPPPTGRPELTVFASRSVSDTGIQNGPLTTVFTTPIITVDSMDTGENHTLNEDIGGRLSFPLPETEHLKSALTFGVDYKHYRLASFNTNNFYALTFVTNSDGSVSQIRSTIHSAQPPTSSVLDYLPFNLGYSGTWKDPLGVTAFSANANINLGGLSKNLVFEMVSTNLQAESKYVVLQLSLDREQALFKGWTVRLHADGQYADSALFQNEQYPMGGANSVRGYQDGEAYGDEGWRVTVEPRTPLFKVGDVDGDKPLWMRSFIFVDYGQLYHRYNALFPDAPKSQEFCGAGCGLTANVGQHFDARLTLAWPLMDDGVRNAAGRPLSPVGSARVYVGIGMQF